MAGRRSNAYAQLLQLGLTALTWVDRWFGALVVDEAGRYSHETLAGLRARGSILRSYMISGWIVLGHDDVRTLLQDRRLSSEVFRSALIQRVFRAAADGGPLPLLDHPNLVNLDPPDHTRLRRLSARSFTNRYVQSMQPDIERIVDELLDPVANEARFDLMTVLARPLPAIVIAEMLGVPVEERHLFETWSAELVGYTELLDPEVLAGAVRGDHAMRVYLAALVERKRAAPADDLVSRLIAAEADDDALTADELLSLCTLLLVAGHETTTRLIGSCVHLLLEHPEQLAAVRADRSLVPAALEEALRLEPPVMALSRIVAEPFDYGGVRFRAGQIVLLSIAAANRNPAVHEDAERFDVGRRRGDHVSFGHGLHLCLGMPLARLEAAVALNALLDRYPTLQAAAAPRDWGTSAFFRGPSTLELSVTS